MTATKRRTSSTRKAEGGSSTSGRQRARLAEAQFQRKQERCLRRLAELQAVISQSVPPRAPVGVRVRIDEMTEERELLKASKREVRGTTPMGATQDSQSNRMAALIDDAHAAGLCTGMDWVPRAL